MESDDLPEHSSFQETFPHTFSPVDEPVIFEKVSDKAFYHFLESFCFISDR